MFYTLVGMDEQEQNNNQDYSKDLKIYRLIEKYLIPIAIILILVVFVFYIIVFSDGLSNEQGHWGLFGDYFGGILNPILSFITIIVLVFTLRLGYQTLVISKEELEKATDMLKLAKEEIKLTQVALEQSKEEVQLAREATQRQVEHLEKESLKIEISTILKEIDSDIQSIFNIIVDFDSAFRYGHYFSATSTENISKRKSYDELSRNDKFQINRLHDLLANMDTYINTIDDLFNRPPLSLYYKVKYCRTAKKIQSYVPDDFKKFEILGKEEYKTMITPSYYPTPTTPTP